MLLTAAKSLPLFLFLVLICGKKRGNLVQPFCHVDINFLPLLGSVLSQTAMFPTVLSRLASLPVTTSFFIRVIL